MDNNRSRIAVVASLVLSASGLIGIAVSEGWEPVARPPVQGDVPTGGFGSTRAESGPMKAGERIDPVRGLILLKRDAAEAERAGLVSRVVPYDKLADEALGAALVIADFSQLAVMAAKESVNRAFESGLSDGVMFERRLFHALFATNDQKEGMDAFVNKRKATFTHS